MTATKASVSRLYVGTSGWSYPSWKPGFYPAGCKPAEFLGHYAERLPSVELNSTGYRIPAEDQFRRWAEQTPAAFRFAVKMQAYQLQQAATFEERVRQLGERLGPIRVLVGSARDEGFLTLALGSLDPELRIAFDFRHDSWAGVELPQNAVQVNDLTPALRSATCASATRRTRTSSSPRIAEEIRPLLAERRRGLRATSGTKTSRALRSTRSAYSRCSPRPVPLRRPSRSSPTDALDHLVHPVGADRLDVRRHGLLALLVDLGIHRLPASPRGCPRRGRRR